MEPVTNVIKETGILPNSSAFSTHDSPSFPPFHHAKIDEGNFAGKPLSFNWLDPPKAGPEITPGAALPVELKAKTLRTESNGDQST